MPPETAGALLRRGGVSLAMVQGGVDEGSNDAGLVTRIHKGDMVANRDWVNLPDLLDRLDASQGAGAVSVHDANE